MFRVVFVLCVCVCELIVRCVFSWFFFACVLLLLLMICFALLVRSSRQSLVLLNVVSDSWFRHGARRQPFDANSLHRPAPAATAHAVHRAVAAAKGVAPKVKGIVPPAVAAAELSVAEAGEGVNVCARGG